MDVADCEAVEQVHHDDHHQEDEDGVEEVAEPVLDGDVRVVHLPGEHHDSLGGRYCVATNCLYTRLESLAWSQQGF